MLSIKETFLSIQGEGYYAGQASYFIRTQGCDIGCHWCDEPKSWDLDAGDNLSFDELMKPIKKTKTKIIIFTGGEPLMHNLKKATDFFKKSDYRLHLETSGAYPLSGEWDWITLSPKKIKPPLPNLYHAASELKIIIHNHHDFKWALDQETKVNNKCLLYLQPEWSRRDEMSQHVIDFILNNPRWNLSLQTHKYLNIQ